jgi:hypothetical protein
MIMDRILQNNFFLRGFKIQDDNLKMLFVILKIDLPPKLEI